MRLVVDRALCLSSGRCVARHPEVFSFDDEQLAVASAGAEAALDDAERRRLVLDCPTGALSLDG